MGASAARALLSLRSWARNSVQGSQLRTCWRTGPDALRRPSAASARSSWTSPQVSRRDWLASASVIRARTRSDLTLGTVVSIETRDLLVGHRVDLAQEQRRALRLGKVRDVGEQAAELVAVLDALEGRGPVLVRVDVHRVDALGDGPAEVVEAAVARDPVEPRARVDVPRVGEHRLVGGDEDLLEHVLGVLARAEHVLAEGEQARLVAVDEDLEGARVAVADERDELLVALELENGRAAGQ